MYNYIYIVECDEMAKLQKAEQEQQIIMEQEMNILRTRQGVEWKNAEVLKPVLSSGTFTTTHYTIVS